MKQVHNLILLVLTGLLCGWTGCEKDDPAMNDALIDDCANQIIDRLGLIEEEPQISCPTQVNLYRLDGEVVYRPEIRYCDDFSRWYTCDGQPVLPDTSVTTPVMERASLLQNLGFVPGDRNCVQETIDRLGLLPADPGTGCRVSVESLLKDERYYFQLSSPNCRLVASPIDCNGDPVCDAGDADCLADFYRNAESGQTIGFLPE